MSSFSLRDNLTIENGKALKWLDATGTNRKDILTLDGFNVVKMNSAGSDIYINSSVNSNTWVNVGNTNNVIVGSKLGIGTSSVSGILSLPSNSFISADSTIGTLTITGGRDTSINAGKLILGGNGTGGNIDIYTGSTSGSGIRFYSGPSSLKRFHIYDTGIINFTPDGSTIAFSIDQTNVTTTNNILLQNTVDSTSTSNGSLILSGGAAIQKSLNIGVSVSSPNAIITNVSSSNLLGTNVSIGSLRISGTASIVTISSGTLWNSGGIASSTGTIGTLVATTSLSTGALVVSGTAAANTVSTGSILGSLGTIGNLVASTGLSTGTLRVSGTANAVTISSGNIWSSGAILGTTGTIGNLVATTSLSTGSLVVSNSTNSVGLTSGSLSVLGGISVSRDAYLGGDLFILDTSDASGIGTGGSLTILGGAAISKRLFANTLSLGTITNEFSGSFSGNNNVSSPSSITGLSFSTTDTRSFTVTMSIVILASSSLYSQVTIEGIWKNGAWEIFTSSLGDQTNITFSITSAGQIQYTSANYVSWISTTFRWSAKVLNQSGTHNPPTLPTTGAQTITGPLTITSTTNSVSGSTGALAVAGGAGIAGDLIVGGNIFSNIWMTQIASSSFSVTASHKNYLFLTSSTSSTLTVSLLSAASAGVNYSVGFTKTDSLNSIIQIVPSAGTIENVYSNYLLSNLNDSVTFISDGSTWRILHSRTPVFYSIYSVPGTYLFTVPNPVTSIAACIFGGGGGGGSGIAGISSGNGGGGGGYCEGIISVTPGETITIIVGEGGVQDTSGESSSVGDLIAYGGGAGGTNLSGSWGSIGNSGSGSGGIINRSGGLGGQAPSQTNGGGGGGGAAGFSRAGSSASGLIGGNGSAGIGATDVDTTGGSIRISNFFREGGGGASGNSINALGTNGGFPGGGGSGASDGSGGYGGAGCVIIYY